jgi:hypothetical protein
MQGWIRNPLTLQARLEQTLNPTFGGPVRNIIRIDRSKPVNFQTFLAEIGQEGGWTESGGDMRASRVREFDLDTVIIGHGQRDYICLDASAFRTVWELRYLLTSRWKTKVNGYPGVITFSGTCFSRLDGLGLLGLSWVDGTGVKRPMDEWTARLYNDQELRVLGDRVCGAFVPDLEAK